MKFLKDRTGDFDANAFINELVEAAKLLGVFEARISDYHFNRIIIPMLHKKEAVSSMEIEGTQTTISDVIENRIRTTPSENRVMTEVDNHIKTLSYGADRLRMEEFSHELIKKLHELMLRDVAEETQDNSVGEYKKRDNYIVNSAGKIVFRPPSYTETKKYMDELIGFLNNTSDGLNPLIKAAISHAQFESIHPFFDGNGRIGRLLVSLYLYKAHVINFPFFYISEAISQDKSVYYQQLTGTRTGDYTEWIRYFLQKIIVQARNHIKYIEDLNSLYNKTRTALTAAITSSYSDGILECLFTQPILTTSYLAEKLQTSVVQAGRYMTLLENNHILLGDDRKRYRRYYFSELLELVQIRG